MSLLDLEKLLACEGNSRSLSLDLYDQWKEMDKDGKWRFTSPTHVVAAFSKAIDELDRRRRHSSKIYPLSK